MFCLFSLCNKSVSQSYQAMPYKPAENSVFLLTKCHKWIHHSLLLSRYTFNKGVEGTGKLTIRKQFGGFTEKATEYVEEFDVSVYAFLVLFQP